MPNTRDDRPRGGFSGLERALSGICLCALARSKGRHAEWFKPLAHLMTTRLAAKLEDNTPDEPSPGEE